MSDFVKEGHLLDALYDSRFSACRSLKQLWSCKNESRRFSVRTCGKIQHTVYLFNFIFHMVL